METEPERVTRRRLRSFLVVALAAVLTGAAAFAAAVIYANVTEGQLRQQQLAGCAFAADIGTLPVTGTPRPSRLAVSLVADSRAQWRGLHCPGTLPVPPGLERWAAYYHLSGK